MKRLGIIALTLALFAAACSKSANNSNSSNTTTRNGSANSTTNSSSANSTSPTMDSSSPSAAYKLIYETAKKKDIAALKGMISQNALSKFGEMAAKENMTVDEALKASIDDPTDPIPPTLEMRNEKVNGDHATLEHKNSKGQWEKVDLVKEGGSWKLDLPEEGSADSPAAPDKDEDKDEGNTDDHGGH